MKLNDLHNLMDDLARTPGPSDSDLAARENELHAALDAHPEWMSEMRSRDAFDVKLCEVMPQVDVPEGLKGRLLAAVSEPPAVTQPALDLDRDRRVHRRAFGLITAATMLTVLAVWMSFPPLTSDLTVADIESELPDLWEVLDSASVTAESTEAVLPSGIWNSSRLRFPHDWKAHDVSGETLAFRKLEFVSTRGRSHGGLLASLPVSSFSANRRPTSTNPFSGEIRYLRHSDGSMLAIVSWTDAQTERVYFLAVPAEDHTLKALEELLYVPAV
jgi:hypothetical protein